MSRTRVYVSAVVLAHFAINVIHGAAHQRLQIGLSPLESAFVIAVILVLPLLAMVIAWTRWKRLALIILAISMFASFLFGLYHHFIAVSADNVNSQPATSLGAIFRLTAYGLLVSEAIGCAAGLYLFRTTPDRSPSFRR